MSDLTELCEKYKSLLEKVIERVEQGEPITFILGEHKEGWIGNCLLSKDISLCLQAAFSNVYDAIEYVKQKDEAILKDIAEKVYFPALDEIFDVLEEKVNVTRERFAEGLAAKYVNETDPRGIRARIYPPVRAYLLLEILARNPEKKDKLTRTSAYYPYKLFKEPTLKEIEDDIAAVLTTLYSHALLDVLPEVDRLVNRARYSSPKWRGPYISCGFKWTGQATKQRIEELYGSEDVKREIFDTLVQCLALIYHTELQMGKGRKNVKSLPHFGLSTSRYGHLKYALRVDALNQMLEVFKNSGGQQVLRNLSTRYTGVRGQIKDEELTIYVGIKPTETLTINSCCDPNRKYLVVCVDTLWGFYQDAKKINRSRR